MTSRDALPARVRSALDAMSAAGFAVTVSGGDDWWHLEGRHGDDTLDASFSARGGLRLATSWTPSLGIGLRTVYTRGDFDRKVAYAAERNAR